MPQGRMLARTIAYDKKLNSISIMAEYLFLKCIPQLDRDGLILYGDGPELYTQVVPRRPELLADIPELVKELVDAGLVTKYDTEEGAVLYFKGFQKNQSLRYDREAPSRYVPPPGFVRSDSGMVADEVRSKSGVTPDEVPPNIIEYKLKEEAQSAFAEFMKHWQERTTRSGGGGGGNHLDYEKLTFVFDEWSPILGQAKMLEGVNIAGLNKGAAATPAYLNGVYRKMQADGNGTSGEPIIVDVPMQQEIWHG